MKKILKKVFFLPPIPTLLIAIPSYGFVIYALTGENVNPAAAYVSYFLSAYALIITVTGITGVIRFVRQGIDQHPLVRKALTIPLVNRLLREDMFRAEAALYQGFFINLLYAGIPAPFCEGSWKPCHVGGKGHQSDGGAGVHALPGNGHADAVRGG